MVAAIRQHVVVKKGGVVEVRSSQLRAGANAEVIVLVDADEQKREAAGGEQARAFEALQHTMGLKAGAAAAWAADARRERKASSRRRERSGR